MNEIVKYHNDFNKIKLPSFTEQEQNLLYGILTRINEKKASHKITFYPQDFANISSKNLSNRELTEILKTFETKFFKADFKILLRDGDLIGLARVNLFNEFVIWKYFKERIETDTGWVDAWEEFERIEIEVNPKFAYLINELTANFTRFELAEFIAISGKYTKTLYRLLKQYRNTGYLKMEWDEFARVMDIPENYRQRDIDERILKPAIKELTKERNLFDTTRIPFENLTYTKIKGKGRGRGGNVIGIEFSFKKQTELLTKDEQIKALREENAELTKEVFENNIAKAENEELKQKIEKLEKIAYGVGLKAYCGLKYYSDKNETLKVLDFNENKNPSNQDKYVAEILNEKTNKSFFLYVESPKHLINIISKNEKDLYFHNQEIINTRTKNIINA